MTGYVFITQGDLTNLSADALAYSSSTVFGGGGQLYFAFRENIPAFARWFSALSKEHPDARIGDAYWLPLAQVRKPYGIVAVVAAGGDVPGEHQARSAVRAATTRRIRRELEDLT